MTIVFTIITKDGIVMSADRKISYYQNNHFVDVGSRDKIIVLEDHKIGISYWGMATIDHEQIKDHVDKIVGLFNNHEEINVDTLSEKCKVYFEQFEPQYPMGLHIAGYVDGKAKLRHVFHEMWHDKKEFTNEESNIEFHDGLGRRIPHTIKEEHINLISLFNGENQIINNILNILPQFGGLNLAIDFEKLSLTDAINLSELLITTTIYIQNFMKIYRNNGKNCGNGLDIVTITEQEIKKKIPSLTTVSIDINNLNKDT